MGNVYHKNLTGDDLHGDKSYTVYPQDYATGSGTAEDPWAGDCIDDAVDAVPAGGTVYMRAGYYSVDGQIYATGKTYNLIGEGIGKTFLVTTDLAANPIYIESNYVTLRGFTIDADAITGEYVTINIQNSNYTTVKDVEIKNGTKTGLNLFQCNYSVIENIYSHDNGGHGVHPGSDTTGKNMYNSYSNIYCYNNTISGFDEDGSLSPYEALYNKYEGIVCWNNTSSGIAATNGNKLTFSNCHSMSNGGYGMYFNQVDDSSISDSTVDDTTSTGIYMLNGDDNHFTNVNVKNGAASGIILSACDDITLTSCNSYDDQGTPTQTYGLGLYNSCTKISILNCKLSPVVTAEIYNDGGTSTYRRNVDVNMNPVVGDILYFDGTNWIRLAKGTAGQVLTINAGATAPEWQTP